MAEVWFYHLQRQSLERALPYLLERALQRGWRAVVQTLTEERVQALDELLWTYSDESFLAHGRKRDGDADLQPIWLTNESDNPNGAAIRIFVEGADPCAAAAGAEYERVIVIFDGADDEQVTLARERWRQLKEQGAALSYWRQGEDGRWEKTA